MTDLLYGGNYFHRLRAWSGKQYEFYVLFSIPANSSMFFVSISRSLLNNSLYRRLTTGIMFPVPSLSRTDCDSFACRRRIRYARKDNLQ